MATNDKVLINCYYYLFYINKLELDKYNLNSEILKNKHYENLKKYKNSNKELFNSNDKVPILNPTKPSFLSYSFILFIKLFI